MQKNSGTLTQGQDLPKKMIGERYKAEFCSFNANQTFIYGNKWLTYDSHMSLSLLALKILRIHSL